MSDVLFTTVERYHEGRKFGRVLDAGTGVNSMKWLLSLPSCESAVGITADQKLCDTIIASGLELRDQDRLLVGNWMNEEFCASLGTFDTIIADYLFGAVDGFSPYAQDLIMKKLKEHLIPGGRLYVIGMYPIPDHAPGAAEIVTEIRRARDACILMAGHRPYREFPSEWIVRQLVQVGMNVKKVRTFTILHSKESSSRQIRVARSKLGFMPNTIQKVMQNYLYDLEQRTHKCIEEAGGTIPLSHDYIIAAEFGEATDTPPAPP